LPEILTVILVSRLPITLVLFLIQIIPFFLAPATPVEISNIIGKLKNSKENYNDISVKILKLGNLTFGRILTDIYNRCLTCGVYPDALDARVTPIYKSGNANCVENFRPISILPTFNKIFEKLTYSRLYSFTTSKQIISAQQFGFKTGSDTQQAIYCLHDYILTALHNKLNCICIFVDFRKAFDTVNHDLLLRKLDLYGIRGLVRKFFESYFKGRKQYTQVGDKRSSILDINIGVPQGSCLAPLLFNIYVNDLTYLFTDMLTVMFADDTVFLKSSGHLPTLVTNMQFKFNNFIEWCKFNRLSLNTDKTKFMVFTSSGYNGDPLLTIDNTPIEKVLTFKYLGLILSSNVKHYDEIDLLTQKLSRFVYITYKIRKYFNLATAKMFYHSLIESQVTYGIAIWGGTLIITTRGIKLQNQQNKIIRNLFGIHLHVHNTEMLYKQIPILKLEDVYRLRVSTIIYSVLNSSKTPEVYRNILGLIVKHSYSTRHVNDLVLPFPHSVAYKCNFIYSSVLVWNSIPISIRQSESLRNFTKSYKNYLFSLYNI